MALQMSREDNVRTRNLAQEGHNKLELSQISANVYDPLEGRNNDAYVYDNPTATADSRPTFIGNPTGTATVASSRLKVELSFKVICAAVIGVLLFCTLICTIAGFIIYHAIKANIEKDGQPTSGSQQTSSSQQYGGLEMTQGNQQTSPSQQVGPTTNTTDALALQIKTLNAEFNKFNAGWKEQINSVTNNQSKSLTSLADMNRQLQTLDSAVQRVQEKQNTSGIAQSTLINKVDDVVAELQHNASQTLEDVQSQVEKMSKAMLDNWKNANESLQTHMLNITAFILGMSDRLYTPPVAFFARDLAEDPLVGKVLRFTKVTLNIGNAYDSSTGYFTAPYRGIYKFSVQMCTQREKALDLQIVSGGAGITGLRHYNKDLLATCTSGEGMAELMVGNLIYIKCLSILFPGTIVYPGNTAYTTSFSGVLLHRTTS